MRTRTLHALFFMAVLTLAGCTASTESTEVGVRTAQLLGRGVVKEIYPQGGTYFFFRPLSNWNVFDVGLQNLEMLREHGEGSRSGDDSLRFKTIDGNDISVNVTVAWQVDPAMAPYVLQFVGKDTEEVEEKLVRPVSRTVIRDTLNQLKSEQYYQAQRRFQMAEEARVRLNSILNAEGIRIEQVLLGEHKFNPTYEQTIKDKKIAEQEAARLHSETEAADEEMKRDLERAKGAVSKAIEEALGESKRKKLEADGILFEREKQAEALLSEKKAKARGLTEQARALAGGGGRSMVKLKVAESLNGKKILFLPAGSGLDVRSTDVNSLLQAYGIDAVVKGK